MSLMRNVFPEWRQMMRHMDDSFTPLATTVFRTPRSLLQETGGAMIPTADLHETEDKYIIETEVPGVKREDLKFDLADDHTIVIKGEVKRSFINKSRAGTERYYGKLERFFSLPSAIDPNKIQAQLEDGILKLEIPKTMETQKRIQINWKDQGEEKVPEIANNGEPKSPGYQ